MSPRRLLLEGADQFRSTLRCARTPIYLHLLPKTTIIRSTPHSHAQLTARTQGNSYDCCHRFYGAPEYPLLIDPDESSYRAVDKYLFADTTEILANTVIVDKEVRERKAGAEKAGSWLTYLLSTMLSSPGTRLLPPTNRLMLRGTTVAYQRHIDCAGKTISVDINKLAPCEAHSPDARFLSRRSAGAETKQSLCR